nr:MAG TPA: hypothetical protein [Caudoviricetes sp.]
MVLGRGGLSRFKSVYYLHDKVQVKVLISQLNYP